MSHASLLLLANKGRALLPTNLRSQYESNERHTQKYESQRSSGDVMRDEPFMGFGYGGIKRMVTRLISPFAEVLNEMMDNEMMDRVNSEMAISMAQEKKSTKALLADPAVRNMVGDSISLGKPFSQSLSKTTVNGVTKSRLQLVIPISGSQATRAASGSLSSLWTNEGDLMK